MFLIIIAILGSLSTAGIIWVAMNHAQDKAIKEERLREITVFKSAHLEKQDATQKNYSYKREKRRGRRRMSLSIPFLMLSSLLLTIPFYLQNSEYFVFKYICILMVSILLKRFWVIIQKAKYRTEIEDHLPLVLDMLVVCIEAGMAINSALVRVAEETKGTALSQELRNTFHEMDMGLPIEDAFKNLGTRTNVQDVQSLATSIIQSEKLGMSLGATLRGQAIYMREMMRTRTKERIIKTPVKLLIPLVLCIFPALFVVLMGPAIINIKTEFLDKTALPEIQHSANQANS